MVGEGYLSRPHRPGQRRRDSPDPSSPGRGCSVPGNRARAAPESTWGAGTRGPARILSVLMLWAVDDGVAGPADVGPVAAVVPALAGHPADEHLVRPPRMAVRAPLGSLLNQRTEHAFEDRTYRARRGQTRSRSPLRVDPDLRCGNLLHLAEGSRRGGQRTAPPRYTRAGPNVAVRRSQRPLV